LDVAGVPARLIRALAGVWIAVGAGVLVWMVAAVFDRVHNTIVVMIFAVLFAYFVYPPIAWLVRRRVPVTVAAILVYAALIVVLLGAGAWLAPAIATQATELAQNFPHIVAGVQQQIADPVHSPLLARLPANVRATIAQNAGKAGAFAAVAAGTFGHDALQILTGTTAAVVDIFLVMGLTLLVLGELATIRAFALRLVPATYRAPAIAFAADVDAVIGGFVRGQVLLALAVSIAGTVVLLAVGVPYAVLLGLLAGVLSIVPLVGPIIAAALVILIAFFTVGVFKLIIVAALYAAILTVQQNVLNPLVVSKSVGVTPLVVFVALLLGSEAFGILGALLSIPLAGILRVATERFFSDGQRTVATIPPVRDELLPR
jgi:predicted PurR-regulated permease PerM